MTVIATRTTICAFNLLTYSPFIIEIQKKQDEVEEEEAQNKVKYNKIKYKKEQNKERRKKHGNQFTVGIIINNSTKQNKKTKPCSIA